MVRPAARSRENLERLIAICDNQQDRAGAQSAAGRDDPRRGETLDPAFDLAAGTPAAPTPTGVTGPRMRAARRGGAGC